MDEGEIVCWHTPQSLTRPFAGKKILLVDFDLRKPTLARNLQLDSTGLTDFYYRGERTYCSAEADLRSF